MKVEFNSIKERLLNSRLSEIGRAADLVCFRFADDSLVAVENEWEYALHIQCPWRIVRRSSIITGIRDIYEPLPDVNYDEWDIPGNNNFDRTLDLQLEHELPLQVLQVGMDKLGGLRIILEEEYVMEIFVVTDLDVESWRFIDKKEDMHLVFENHNLAEV